MAIKIGGTQEQGPVISGPMCPINPKPAGKAMQGGAFTSAFLSAFL